MAEDRWRLENPKVTAPSDDGFYITPDDDTDLAYVTRGIYIGTSGNLAVMRKSGNTIIYPNLAAGVIHPIRCIRVLATGTTVPADQIIGEY